ncbi:MAG: carbohydrate transporter rane protein 1, family [Bacteroidetes bacterium]|nr:carbohydrate transporter rane protein 1, family [Bacteroidota bacterium]
MTHPFRAQLRRDAAGYAFIAPWLIGFVLLTAGPMVVSVYLSGTSWTMLSPPVPVGLANYEKILVEDELFMTSLQNTLYYVVFSVPLGLVVSLILAMMLHQRLRGISVFRTIFFLPSITNMVAVSMLWLWVFNPEFGLLNALLGWVGIEGPLWLQSESWAKPSLIIMSLWGVGGTMIVFLAALQGIPQELYEAADLDGAGRFRRLIHITLPMISPAMLFNLIIGVIGSFQVFTQAFVMTGTAQPGSEGGPNNATLFVVLYLYKKAFQEFRMGYASALAWILFFLILAVTLVQMRLSRRWVHYEAGER